MKNLSRHITESFTSAGFDKLFEKRIKILANIVVDFEITKYPSGYISYSIKFSIHNVFKGSFNNTVSEDTTSKDTTVYMKHWYGGKSSSAVKISKTSFDRFLEITKDTLTEFQDLPDLHVSELKKTFIESAEIFEKTRMSKR